MKTVDLIFHHGPKAAVEWFSQLASPDSVDAMDVKELADICWTRASTLAKVNPSEAREWGKAALAGYEYLSQHGKSTLAETSREDVAALRSSRLLAGD